MPRYPTPMDWWENSMTLGMIAAESQTVMTMRIMGMMGLWPVAGGENSRMVTEKSDAMTEAMMKAGFAAFAGRRPEDVTKAALGPIRRRTKANQKRLVNRLAK